MVFLFRLSAKSLNAQEERLATSPAIRDSSEVARAQNQRCYPHTGNGGHSLCLSSSLSLSVGSSVQGEAMDVARSAPLGLTTMETVFTCFLNWE